MKADDIKDEETLRAWITPALFMRAQCLAVRSALRVFPIFAAAMDADWAQQNKLTALDVLRWVLDTSNAKPVVPGFEGESPDQLSAPMRAALSAAMAVDPSNPSYTMEWSDKSFFPLMTLALSVSCAEATARTFDNFASGLIWEQVREDARLVEAGQDPMEARLWSTPHPSWFTEFNRRGLSIWSRDPETWFFWTRWWDGVLSGNQLDWDLQRQVALIPNEIWEQGPAAVAEAIRQIEGLGRGKPTPDPVEQALVTLPPSSRDVVTRFSDAVTQHHEDIPPTLDALLLFCRREIDRLQGRNAPYATPEEEAEAQRQIRVLTTIYTTLEKLRDTIPADGALTPARAERGEKLSRLFVRSFKEWPRKNVEDIADSTCRAALVGLTATLAPMIGIPVAIATGAGVVLFGGKKVADGLKAAKDLKDMGG